jgi:hypothetical protein
MATNRTFIRHHLRSKLTPTQEMELWLGPSHHGSVFRSREELQQAWLNHRDRLMAVWGKHGKRPMAWWEFEAPFPRPSKHERSKLYEAGLLGEEEAAELVREWRKQFDRAHEPHFFFCQGPGRILEGAPARAHHFAWADIPRALLRQWTAEHRRRAKTIRKLEKPSEEAAERPEPAA